MICLNCGVEYSHIGKYKRFCSSRCQNTYYKNRQSGPFTIKGQLIDDKLLAELLEKNIVVAYLDVSGEPHYGLKPAARRLIYGLRIPMGFNILHFGVSKMTTKTAHVGITENAQRGQNVPHRENGVKNSLEVE